jgi:hypothetical protein
MTTPIVISPAQSRGYLSPRRLEPPGLRSEITTKASIDSLAADAAGDDDLGQIATATCLNRKGHRPTSGEVAGDVAAEHSPVARSPPVQNPTVAFCRAPGATITGRHRKL